MRHDLVIKGGAVYDGRNNPPVRLDIGLKGDSIHSLGSGLSGDIVIDAYGLAVCPGFIDIHSHSDYYHLINPRAESKIRQGVTSEVVGNCGYSAAPVEGKILEERRKIYRQEFGLDLDWRSMTEYYRRMEAADLTLNLAPLVGHNTVRAAVMGGSVNRPPTALERKKMSGFLRASMEAGAWGLSTGLIYPPACFAGADELVELNRAVAERGGVFTTHIRSEGPGLVEAVAEVIGIARESGVSLQISHLKTSGSANWHKLGEVFKLIESAREEGLDVTADRYPYLASNAGLGVLLPDWALEGGAETAVKRLKTPETRQKIREEIREKHPSEFWEAVRISVAVSEKSKIYEGKNVREAAGSSDRIEFVFDLLIENKMQVEAIYFTMCRENLERIIRKPYVMVASDSAVRADYGPLSRGCPHPRAFGTFPRAIREFALNRELLELKEVIYKMTGFPASKLGLCRRGTIEEGAYADLVVFDPGTITDRAGYDDPFPYPAGITQVLVNGKLIIDQGTRLDRFAGLMLRK
ncbi:MAG: amidohydrolase family protein [bacterium]